jgi:Protein of unknown function (DUF2934)
MEQQDRIFVGTMQFTTDNFLLAPDESGGGQDFVDVDFGFQDETLNHQRVSILGHMRDGTIVARKVILHQDIASRAYGIWESGDGGTDLDNWLRAERELLESEDRRTKSAHAS